MVFEITPAGTFTILHSFAGDTNENLHSGPTLIQASDGKFYGILYSRTWRSVSVQ
jgi:hypothetical protein